MKTINVYTIQELKEQFPDAYDKALANHKNEMAQDPYLPWQYEIMDSLKATFKHAGITLQDWSIGAYDRCYVKFTIPTYWSDLADNDILVDDLEGRKAYKWLKETFDIKSYKRINYKNHLGKPAHRYDFQKLDGKDWSCEFTGYCADHDFLENLFECVHDGMNIKDSFHNLADVAGMLFENEYEYMMSEEYFLEQASCDDWDYTEDGDRI